MSFMPKNFLKDAVEEKNLRKIRVALSTYITKDPGNIEGQIEDAVRYVETKFGYIWEKHNGKKEEPRENWDNNYIGTLQSDLMMNFSKERFNHILKVGQTLYSKSQNKISQTKNRKIKNNKSVKGAYNRSIKKEDSNLGKLIAVGMGVVGATLAAIKIYQSWKK